jgi:hypothetical protein
MLAEQPSAGNQKRTTGSEQRRSRPSADQLNNDIVNQLDDMRSRLVFSTVSTPL